MQIQEQQEHGSAAAVPSHTGGERQNRDYSLQLEPSKKSPNSGAVQFLGWFSIGLGVFELVFPKKFGRMIGAPPKPMTTRVLGLREIGVGMGILTSESPAPWIKARVAGDMIDVALLKRSFGSTNSNAVRLTGATMAAAAITTADIVYARKLSEPDTSRIGVEVSMAVNKSAEECYRFWRQIENFPQFMDFVEEVRVTGDRTSHWKLKPHAMKIFQWDAEITRDEAGKVIEWGSLPGGDIKNFGAVRFEPILSGTGTYVRLFMEYTPQGAAGSFPAGIMKMISKHAIREDLRRFKNVIECGETPTTEGQPSGGQARQGGKNS